jgi:hypothetical protein
MLLDRLVCLQGEIQFLASGIRRYHSTVHLSANANP